MYARTAQPRPPLCGLQQDGDEARAHWGPCLGLTVSVGPRALPGAFPGCTQTDGRGSLKISHCFTLFSCGGIAL